MPATKEQIRQIIADNNLNSVADKESLAKYPELKERMQNLLQNREKIIPKQWKAEIQSLQSDDGISKKSQRTLQSQHMPR